VDITMIRPRWLALAAAFLALGVPGSSSAQNVAEWSSESRMVLNFRVRTETLQKMLPAGWVVAPSTSAATPGANLNVTLMERTIVLDPQGKPLKSGTSRYTVLGVPARNTQTGQTNTIVVSGISPEGEGAYGVYLTATRASLERTVTGDGEAQARVQEAWQLQAGSGDQIELRISYRRGPVTKAHVETVVRSAARPAFSRTYRIDQAADLLKSAAGSERVEQLQFRASGPLLATLFDGTEVLLGATAIPFYVREISVP
jgi:hypothetical protein